MWILSFTYFRVQLLLSQIKLLKMADRREQITLKKLELERALRSRFSSVYSYQLGTPYNNSEEACRETVFPPRGGVMIYTSSRIIQVGDTLYTDIGLRIPITNDSKTYRNVFSSNPLETPLGYTVNYDETGTVIDVTSC
jgi:hypothetical protein